MGSATDHFEKPESSRKKVRAHFYVKIYILQLTSRQNPAGSLANQYPAHPCCLIHILYFQALIDKWDGDTMEEDSKEASSEDEENIAKISQSQGRATSQSQGRENSQSQSRANSQSQSRAEKELCLGSQTDIFQVRPYQIYFYNTVL